MTTVMELVFRVVIVVMELVFRVVTVVMELVFRVVTACIPNLTWLLSPMTESSALIKDKQWKYENKTDFNLPRENNKPCLPPPGTRPTPSSGSQSPVSVSR